MTTATRDSIHPGFACIEAAKAALRQRFEEHLARASEAVVLKAVGLADEKAFAALAKVDVGAIRTVATRNQEAIARMKARAFERVSSRCELLDAKAVCEILGISKQALSQKTKAGKLLAYTNIGNRRKFYPSFQFAENKPRAVVEELITSLDVDPADTEAMNFLVQHLVGRMDYSEPGGPGSELPRFELLDDSAAVEIIKRDFVNAFDDGQ
ncbi:helix-turn-helix transcriptional regulator [Pseudomonas sp. NPDC090592]|uniref:helix-turn-helix transcriptional regulator n=1 Tax=Pseudomonas sp. NPDC090592 TaxID=3364480 RepID=UPI00383AA975